MTYRRLSTLTCESSQSSWSRSKNSHVHVGGVPCFDKRLFQNALRAITITATHSTHTSTLRTDAALADAAGQKLPGCNGRHTKLIISRTFVLALFQNLMTSRAVVYYKPQPFSAFPKCQRGTVYLQFPPTTSAVSACLSKQVRARQTATPQRG